MVTVSGSVDLSSAYTDMAIKLIGSDERML
jgi:hypothetical protein